MTGYFQYFRINLFHMQYLSHQLHVLFGQLLEELFANHIRQNFIPSLIMELKAFAFSTRQMLVEIYLLTIINLYVN